MKRFPAGLLAVAAALTLMSGPCAAAGTARYTFEALGKNEGKGAQPKGISPGGRTTGWWCCVDGDDHQPFTYRAGRFRTKPGQPGETAGGDAINDRGVFVGWSVIERVRTSFYQDEAGRHTIGEGNFAALDINDAGQVAGYLLGPDSTSQAAIYSIADGVFTPLSALDHSHATPSTINNAGTVGGYTGFSSNRCFVYRDATMIDLGTLGGDTCHASDINDQDEMVGTSRTAQGRPHAFVWRGGELIDLLPKRTKSEAFGINNRGQIVGSMRGAGEFQDTFFLYENGKAVPLKDLLSPEDAARLESIYEVSGISDRGEITGTGWFDDAMRGFILKPSAPSR